MEKRLHIDVEPPVQRDGALVISARVQGHPQRKRNGAVWFEFPVEVAHWAAVQGRPDDLHDAFLRALIFSAMEAGLSTHVHGNVSVTLLENLEAYQQIIASWWPQYRPVAISADREVAPTKTRSDRNRREAVLTFSGGLDSIYSLYCHQREMVGRNSRNIPVCLFVHGFDIPLEDNAFGQALERARCITERLNTRLLAVRSNLKQMLPNWNQTHAGGLAAVLSLFEERFHAGLIASSVTYANPYLSQSGFGSTPLTDPLLSSDTFRVIHDTATKGRVAKSSALRHFDVAWQNLRVCWAGNDLSGNCGCCDKCLWQMLCMKAVGLDVRCAFPRDIDCEQIFRFASADPAHLEDYKECLAYAERSGRAQSPEFLTLRQAIAMSECKWNAIGWGTTHRSAARYGLQWLARRLARAA